MWTIEQKSKVFGDWRIASVWVTKTSSRRYLFFSRAKNARTELRICAKLLGQDYVRMRRF
jgi:hypothetical protein